MNWIATKKKVMTTWTATLGRFKSYIWKKKRKKIKEQ